MNSVSKFGCAVANNWMYLVVVLDTCIDPDLLLRLITELITTTSKLYQS